MLVNDSVRDPETKAGSMNSLRCVEGVKFFGYMPSEMPGPISATVILTPCCPVLQGGIAAGAHHQTALHREHC